MMYYMYIFALKLSESNVINILYICKFQRLSCLLMFLVETCMKLVAFLGINSLYKGLN